MRCLHCNKKLSLLKLAKGDSFCSAEHFDAYQLQLSKTAYDRLVSVPEEEGPKTPLVFTPVEAPSAEMEADSALARLSAFRIPDSPVPAPAFEAPPYAGFLSSPLPSFPPPIRLLSASDADEPVAAPANVAFPVHDVDATACILSLYLRLSLSGNAPRAWAPVWSAMAAAEAFPGQVARPLLAVDPCEPEIETVEEVAAAEPPGAQVEPIEQLEPVFPAPQETHLNFAEPPKAVIHAGPVQPVDTLQEAPCDFTEAAAAEPAPVQADPILVTPVPPSPAEPKRLAFLSAPSFRARESEATPFDAAASSAPREWKMIPVLDRATPPAPPSPGSVPQSTGFLGTTSFTLKDRPAGPIQSGFELRMEPWILLPEKGAVKKQPWRILSQPVNIARRPLEVIWPPASAVDSTAPAPAPVRPPATLPPRIDRGQILNGAAFAIVRSVLETRLRGQEPAFQARPADELQIALPSILSSFPAGRGFSSRTWANASGRFSLPSSLADSVSTLVALPCQAIEWPTFRSAQPPHADPSPAGLSPQIHLPSPEQTRHSPRVTAGEIVGKLFERTYTLPASANFGHPRWSAELAARLLPATNIPRGHKTIELCPVTAAWEPCAPATGEIGLFRFLPVRRSAVLPSARAWPRLGALPQ